jgi:rhamnosyltransferase
VISVVIPVKDGGDDLRRCLEAIARQRVDDEVEVVVVDSGSRDGSRDMARGLGAVVHEIAPEEFNHGATRNLGAGIARGDLLVFTSQDAYAVDESWLARLTEPLRGDTEVVAAYGRQLPHEHATPPEVFFLDFLYGPRPRLQSVAGPEEISMETTLFSNANSAMRRSAWQAMPFADDLVMSEDQEWSRRALLAGHAIAYRPDAAVRHSHEYTIASAFRRFFDSGASARRAYVGEPRGSGRVLKRRAREYALGELRWLWRLHRRWIPYAVVYEGARFVALQLGAREQHLPLGLKRRLSALPEHWTRR